MSALTSAPLGSSKTSVAQTGAVEASEASSSVFDDAKSLSDYVLIRKSKANDVKSSLDKPQLSRQTTLAVASNGKPSLGISLPSNILKAMEPLNIKAVLKAGSRKNGYGKLKNLKIDLWSHVENNSSANTANTTVVNVDASASGEYSSLAAIYDEFIIHACTVYSSLASTGGTPIEAHWNVAYDCTDNTAMTSYVASLSASQKTGPQRAASPGIVNSLSGPIPASKDGHIVWRIKIPVGAAKTAAGGTTTDNLATGMWCSTTSPGLYGFIKPYVEAVGASVITSLATTLCMHCEFRSRI